jgi:hypothetical protein
VGVQQRGPKKGVGFGLDVPRHRGAALSCARPPRLWRTSCNDGGEVSGTVTRAKNWLRSRPDHRGLER